MAVKYLSIIAMHSPVPSDYLPDSSSKPTIYFLSLPWFAFAWKNFEYQYPPFNHSALDHWRQNCSSRNNSLSLSFSKFAALRFP
ncbi:hypothetical protein PanWU01x14_323850 [Parasponia andersonii]|uniref:Uncharacterized protein n=1 Tax=Parasponia andersonii TaxID=3476 RepID=A0A2P5AKB5_PARAD|nr:hypothetical protein PanWU01x14_323850 [Parasponia andersonii]